MERILADTNKQKRLSRKQRKEVADTEISERTDSNNKHDHSKYYNEDFISLTEFT